MRINKRHFVRQFSKYLENPGTYELEAWGKVCEVVTISKKTTEEVVVKSAKTEYGCGCSLVETKPLCPKHGRF
jgi:hypothetical protein